MVTASVVVAVSVVSVVSDGAAPAPAAAGAVSAVRARLGDPQPGAGLSGTLEVNQSLLPGAIARAVALSGSQARGRLWVAAPNRWRIELQGQGHDPGLVRDGERLALYDDAGQRVISAFRALAPASFRDIGPVRADVGPPQVVDGRWMC